MLLATISLFVVAGAAPSTSLGSGGLRAVYQGVPIPLSQVASHHCHDVMYPLIECFDSGSARDLDLAAHDASNAPSSASASALLTSYVTWYEAINYGGSSFTASSSYSDLSSISWDNRISSFKSLNGGRPKWWQNSNFSGISWHWLAGAQIPDVGSSANDQFSSVQNVP